MSNPAMNPAAEALSVVAIVKGFETHGKRWQRSRKATHISVTIHGPSTDELELQIGS